MTKILSLLLLFLSLQGFSEGISYSIRIVEQHSKAPIRDAYVRAIDLTAGKTTIAVSNDSGFVVLQLNANNKYRVDVSKKNTEEGVKYISYSYFVSDKEILHPVFNEVSLERVSINSQIRLANIYFETGSATLTGTDKIALSNTLIALKNSPHLFLEIGVHAACNEPDGIADKRLEALQEYFSNKGELAKRIQFKNYGKDNQKGGCNCQSPMIYPDEVYSMNRVAEFKILNL